MHKTTRIKVNAWVDVGVVPLVSALNEFDEVETVDSCEGYDGHPYVYFRCQTPQETVDFSHRLWGALGAHFGSSSEYDVSITYVGTGEPLVKIQTTEAFLGNLAEALAAVRTRELVTANA